MYVNNRQDPLDQTRSSGLKIESVPESRRELRVMTGLFQ